MKKITTPLKKKEMEKLKAGEEVLLSGIVYTARDQAHKRLCEALKKKQGLPFLVEGSVIYYCGPTPAQEGKAIGSCGPTTSSRMDEFTLPLLSAGLSGTIGKGRRSRKVRDAIKRLKGVYFLAFAGCGALISGYVKAKEAVAYKELGPEAIYKLEVKDFPLIVGIDAKGRDIYGQG